MSDTTLAYLAIADLAMLALLLSPLLDWVFDRFICWKLKITQQKLKELRKSIKRQIERKL